MIRLSCLSSIIYKNLIDTDSHTTPDFDIFRRFLRARKFDVKQTKKMWVDCERWRKEFGVQQLFENWKETEDEKEHVRKSK
jgi:hypothetical protein